LSFKDIDGKDIFLLGANYWPSSSALNMWTEWNPNELSGDVRRMKQLGMNVCRPFLYMPAFMEEENRVSPLMLEKLQVFLGICEKNKLHTLPTFIVGHMSGEDWDVLWRQGANFITDRRVVEATKFYITTIVNEIKDFSYILGWLLSNELPNYIGKQSPDDIENWIREIIYTIKKEDPDRPVSIGDGAAWSPEILGENSDFHLRKLNQYQDFVGLHYYPRVMNPWHHSYTTAFRIRMAQEWQRPVIVEEFGTSTTLCSEDNQANYYRSVFYSALINGAKGTLGWCLNDFDFEDKRPYSHHAYEERFGVVRTDKTLKPAALEFTKFREIAGELTQKSYRKIEHPVGLFIPSNYYYEYPYQFQPEFKDWYALYLETFSLLKRANLDVKITFEPAQVLENDGKYSHELNLNPEEITVLFVPRLKVVTKKMRMQLEKYIQNGGVLYFSFANDSWVLDWHLLAGIEMDCKFGVPDFRDTALLEVRVKQDWGKYNAGDRFLIPLDNSNPEYGYCVVLNTSGNVIMEDQFGDPFLIEHKVGKGKIYFTPYPVEMLSLSSLEDRWKTDWAKVYQSIYRMPYSDVEFSLDGDGLEMGIWEIPGKDVYKIIILNHSWNETHGILYIRKKSFKIDYCSSEYELIGTNRCGISLGRKGVCIFDIQYIGK
jgi:endo-1,4-beta-mannosidase